MSQSNPNEEERNRMVDAAMRHAMSTSPDLKPPASTDLDRLFKSFADKCLLAQQKALPIIEGGIQTNTIHSGKGRAELLLRVHQELLSVFMDYSKDEAIFLLAWSHANWIMNENA